jgi:hypothetical protein
MKRLWVWSVFECSPELVALLGSVVALQMLRTLLLKQVFEAARGLLRVVFRRSLDSRDCVVWLALAIRTRVVVVVATSIIPVVVVVVVVIVVVVVVVVVAARVVLALAANGVVLGVRLVLFVGP